MNKVVISIITLAILVIAGKGFAGGCDGHTIQWVQVQDYNNLMLIGAKRNGSGNTITRRFIGETSNEAIKQMLAVAIAACNTGCTVKPSGECGLTDNVN